MALTTPSTVDEVIDRVVTDVFTSLAAYGAKPSLKNSWLNALIRAYSNRVFDFYYALDQAALEVFPDTAVENLDRIAAIWGVTRKAGNVAAGNVVVNGSAAGAIIPAGTKLSQGDGTEYVTTAEVILPTVQPGVTLILRAGPLVIVTTTVPHGITTDNVRINVTGCTQPEYNIDNIPPLLAAGSASVLIYLTPGSPTSPATGSPVVTYYMADLPVESVEFSEDANLDYEAPVSAIQQGGSLIFQSPIVDVDDTTVVGVGGITNGVDQETDDSLRARLLDRIHHPVAHFNSSDISSLAKTIAGVTRVWVYEITPQLGMVTVYFMRDDDASAIPDSAEIAVVKDLLDTIRPANTDPDELIVLAPSAVPIDFSFSSVEPNTTTMKAAVQENLSQFFKEKTEVGENVVSDAYRSAIYNTVDPTDGSTLESFTLDYPTGDQGVAAGEIGTLGDVSGL